MFTVTKTETESFVYRFKFERVLEYVWQPAFEQDTGEYVRPTQGNGFEYECTTAGQTGSREPNWPTTIAQTVTDGSVVWTCRAFSTNATDTIASVNVEADTGITVDSETVVGNTVLMEISGGTDTQSYVVSCEITTSAGEVLEEKLTVVVAGD